MCAHVCVSVCVCGLVCGCGWVREGLMEGSGYRYRGVYWMHPKRDILIKSDKHVKQEVIPKN